MRRALRSIHSHTPSPFRLLLRSGRVDPSARNNYAIRKASESGDLLTVMLLLGDDRVDPTARNNYAIRMASSNGHATVVHVLLADRRVVDPAASDNYAIRHAAQKGHTKIVQRLLNSGRVDPSAVDNYALKAASAFGYAEIVQMLLEDPRVRPAASTALWKAYQNGHVAVARVLLAHVTSDDLEHLLQSATSRGDAKFIALLRDTSSYDQYGSLKQVPRDVKKAISYLLTHSVADMHALSQTDRAFRNILIDPAFWEKALEARQFPYVDILQAQGMTYLKWVFIAGEVLEKLNNDRRIMFFARHKGSLLLALSDVEYHNGAWRPSAYFIEPTAPANQELDAMWTFLEHQPSVGLADRDTGHVIVEGTNYDGFGAAMMSYIYWLLSHGYFYVDHTGANPRLVRSKIKE